MDQDGKEISKLQIQKTMKGFREKCEKLHFGAFWPKMANFWTVFKKVLGTFFPPLQALTNYKVSEKSNEGILRKRVANGWTDGQTDEG